MTQPPPPPTSNVRRFGVLVVAVLVLLLLYLVAVEYYLEAPLLNDNEGLVVGLAAILFVALASSNALLDIFYRLIRLFGAVMLAGVICLTVYDVFMRFFFNDPVLGSNEMIQFTLGPMVFAGIAMVTYHRSHIVVSIFEPVLLRLMPRLYRLLIASFNLIGMVIVTFLVIRFTEFQRLVKQETETLDFKWWHLGVAFTILCCIGVVFGIKALWAPRPRPRSEPHHAE